MFIFNKKFQELWAKIPKIVTYRNYCQMANTIDDARTNREITERDKTTLLKALDIFKDARGIKDDWRD